MPNNNPHYQILLESLHRDAYFQLIDFFGVFGKHKKVNSCEKLILADACILARFIVKLTRKPSWNLILIGWATFNECIPLILL